MSTVEANRIIAGKYRLDERIAAGGMGAIWRGWDLRLEAPVAIKFMRKELAEDPPQRARFEREAKAAAQIRSPHVVHMYDHGIDDGTPYIVMEWLEGEDLGQRIKRLKQLSVREVQRICTEICRGLHRAHRRDIVHRDLKPGNVFLSAPDDDLVKILDFGIAKAKRVRAAGSEATTTGQLLGSPHYMSPEQARGMALDGRSDLWSLAIILYRALTGQHPFRGLEVGDLIVRICTDPIPPPSTFRPGLLPSIDQFFLQALQREPGKRFQTAREFAKAFDHAVAAADGYDEAGPVSETSWDSTRASGLHAGVDPASDSASGPVGVTPFGTSGRASADLVAGTPTGASGTLGSVAAAPRAQTHRRLWMVGGGLLALSLGGAIAIWVGTMDGSSIATHPAATQNAAAHEPETSSPAPSESAAATTTPTPPELPDAGKEVADPAPSAQATAEAKPAARPRRPRPVSRPRPKPTSRSSSPGYKPSDLGY